jgi:hypothetical protein
MSSCNAQASLAVTSVVNATETALLTITNPTPENNPGGTGVVVRITFLVSVATTNLLAVRVRKGSGTSGTIVSGQSYPFNATAGIQRTVSIAILDGDLNSNGIYTLTCQQAGGTATTATVAYAMIETQPATSGTG